MVSMKLAAVHSPTIAPNHSRAPVRAVSTSLIGPASTLRDVGRQLARIVATASCAVLRLRRADWATAAARMKNGNSASSAR